MILSYEAKICSHQSDGLTLEPGSKLRKLHKQLTHITTMFLLVSVSHHDCSNWVSFIPFNLDVWQLGHLCRNCLVGFLVNFWLSPKSWIEGLPPDYSNLDRSQEHKATGEWPPCNPLPHLGDPMAWLSLVCQARFKYGPICYLVKFTTYNLGQFVCSQ